MRTETISKVDENRMRRMAARQGYGLVKSKTRDPRAVTYGGWMIINAETGAVEAGGHAALTASEVAAFLKIEKPRTRPAFIELEKVHVAPVGPRNIVAFTLDEAYVYDIFDDAGNDLMVKDYAVSLMYGGPWGTTALEWAAGDFETWSAYLRAQHLYRNLQITLEQATEDKVEGAYLKSLSRRMKKAWGDLQEAYKPIRKGLDEAKARVEAAKIRAEVTRSADPGPPCA